MCIRSLVLREEARVHQRVEHGPGLVPPLTEHRQQLGPIGSRPRALRRHQVPEDLPDHPLPLRSQPCERRLRVLGQRSRDAVDPLVGFPREEPPAPVPLLPQARDREGQERQRPALGRHRFHHLLDQRVLFEPHAPPQGRLHQGPLQRLRGGRRERREVVEDTPQTVLPAAAEQEVVPQRQQDVDLGLLRKAAEERREASLHLRSVQGKELLELVQDDEGFVALLPPAPDRGERTVGLPAQAQLLDTLEQLSDRLGIAGEIGDQGAGERQGRAGPGVR